MKKLLLILLLMLPCSSFAQVASDYLEQNVAKPILIDGILTSGGLILTTSTGQNLQFAAVKEDGTETTWTPTGSHACVSKSYGLYCSLAAADVNQLGHLHISMNGTNIKPWSKDFTVIAAVDKALNIDGSVNTALNTLPKATAVTGFPIFAHQRGAPPNVGVTGGSASCTKKVNNGSGFAAESTAGLSGYTNLSGGDWSVDFDISVVGDRTILTCTFTGTSAPADIFKQYIFAQR